MPGSCIGDLKPMKVLIGVITCHKHSAFQQAIRNTWLPHTPKEVDVRFFSGRGAKREPREDEVFLENAGDEYLDLPEKVKAMFTWAYEHGYDFAMKLDNDVVLKPQEWYNGFYRDDFSGYGDVNVKNGEIKTPWGFAYVLSRKAMELIVNAPLPGQPGSMWSTSHSNDEAFVSSVLHWNGIYLHNDSRYVLFRGKPTERDLSKVHRPLRRPRPMEKECQAGAFATCIYLNWNGFHMTPDEEILREFHRVFSEGK